MPAFLIYLISFGKFYYFADLVLIIFTGNGLYMVATQNYDVILRSC